MRSDLAEEDGAVVERPFDLHPVEHLDDEIDEVGGPFHDEIRGDGPETRTTVIGHEGLLRSAGRLRAGDATGPPPERWPCLTIVVG